MQIVLIGEKTSERTVYFIKAAEALGIAVRLIPFPTDGALWAFDFSGLKNCAVKLDPPDMNSTCIDELNVFRSQYAVFLNKLQTVEGIQFLNTPESILNTLDKLYCKCVFAENGVNSARFLTGMQSVSDLRESMRAQRMGSVFIKPRFGSGAAGVIAFRRNCHSGEEVIYTTAKIAEGRLYNTRQQRRIRDRQEIESIINGVLRLDAIVEQWIPKATVGGKAYDLRVIRQFDRIECAVARLSSGVITNLHLGGEVKDIDALQLSEQTLYHIEELCERAVRNFPGLHSAGIDVLLERSTLKPYIIEINGQGDLLYKDIFSENKIYKNQLLYLKNIL